MARPTTKGDLLEAATGQFHKLRALLDSMSAEEQTQNFTFEVEKEKEAHWKRDRNIRDVLMHLYEWHQLLLNWTKFNLRSEARPFLLAPYNWKNYGEMNMEFWKNCQATSYGDAQNMLVKSHGDVMGQIEKFSNEELFEKGKFDWTGGTTLGSYCVSVTSSHYDWAMKKIKKHIKTLK